MNHGGSRVGAGRHKRATAQRNGRVYVALDMVDFASVKGISFDRFTAKSGSMWHVGNNGFTDYSAAVREFVRRVNG